MKAVKLTISHLYPDLMNTYGDRGNIVTLCRRASWRGIEVEVRTLSLGPAPGLEESDLIFFGGGQDKEQQLVASDLREHKARLLKKALEDGVVALAVCGGYQLLGRYYRTASGEELPGLGLLDVHTVAGTNRLIGNVVIRTSLPLEPEQDVIGFENHSGRTYLGKNASPFGKALVGNGNNGTDGLEGCVYENVIGTYLHGPLLPKNPHLVDYLLRKALERRHGFVELTPLDDGIEVMAHQAAMGQIRMR